MSRTTDAIDWLTPFHESAEGRTSEAIDAALANFATADQAIRQFVIREGLRVVLHAARRGSGIRVNGDPDTLPLFVAMEDSEGITVHRPRLLVPVSEIARQVKRWSQRQSEATKELSWWSHQADLAVSAGAGPDDSLRNVWDQLGLSYTLFIASSGEVSA